MCTEHMSDACTMKTGSPPVRGLRRFWRVECSEALCAVIRVCVRASGLFGRGWHNAHTVIHRTLAWRVPGLDPAFSGLRILFLSDLHLDGPARTTDRLLELLPAIDADLAILGGDYRWKLYGSSDGAARELMRLAPVLRFPFGTFGVLGNHDEPSFIDALAAAAIQPLANRCQAVAYNGAKLWIAGVEDSNYWRRDDLDAALAGIPAGAVTLLVSHAQELVKPAARRGVRLWLSGHTHWGQIALPGGMPVVTHAAAGRRFARGFWREGGMVGYTTSGAGVCGVPVRFNTHSEVVTLVLQPC